MEKSEKSCEELYEEVNSDEYKHSAFMLLMEMYDKNCDCLPEALLKLIDDNKNHVRADAFRVLLHGKLINPNHINIAIKVLFPSEEDIESMSNRYKPSFRVIESIAEQLSWIGGRERIAEDSLLNIIVKKMIQQYFMKKLLN